MCELCPLCWLVMARLIVVYKVSNILTAPASLVAGRTHTRLFSSPVIWGHRALCFFQSVSQYSRFLFECSLMMRSHAWQRTWLGCTSVQYLSSSRTFFHAALVRLCTCTVLGQLPSESESMSTSLYVRLALWYRRFRPHVEAEKE